MPHRFSVTVSTPTPFHLFHLAKFLTGQGLLDALFCGLPRMAIDPLIRHKVQTVPVPILIDRLGAKILTGRALRELHWWTIEAFDQKVSRRIGRSSVVVTLSGRGLSTIRRSKELGAITVCDRGSTHIRHQDQVLSAEHQALGIPYDPIDPRGIDKEESEYREADAVTVPSHHARNTFVNFGVPPEKIHVLPYGVDLEIFRSRDAEPATFNVLFVGRIGIPKGVHYLIEAANLIGAPVHLTLIGAATDGTRQLLSRAKIPVTTLPPMSKVDLARQYQKASVFVMPSVDEGLALVQAEAMASGVPVIATRATGSLDLFSDGVEGFIVPERDPFAIADKLAKLRSDPTLRMQMGEAARTKAASLGGWNRYGAAATDLYRRLAGCPNEDTIL